MYITITGGTTGSDRGIAFESELGRCHGLWMGHLPVPDAGDFDVEFSCDDALAWGVDICAAANVVAPCLESKLDGVKAVGTLLTLDEDMATIALGPTFVVLEVVGDAPVEFEGLTIEAKLQVVLVFPTGYLSDGLAAIGVARDVTEPVLGDTPAGHLARAPDHDPVPVHLFGDLIEVRGNGGECAFVESGHVRPPVRRDYTTVKEAAAG